MIDWLLRNRAEPSVAVGGRDLPLAIRRHPRATRLTMRLAPDGSEVRITMPRWGRMQDALTFARARADWLAQQLQTLPAPLPIAPGGTLPYRGRALAIDWAPALPRRPQLTGTAVQVGGPADTVQQRLQRWLEGKALALMTDDLAHYCHRAGHEPPPLRLSRATRRWGSCSATGTIRINWRLIQAPDAVRRSVVAHEVAHLSHFDHSPAFHAHLAWLFDGDMDSANGWLKAQGRGLYSAFG